MEQDEEAALKEAIEAAHGKVIDAKTGVIAESSHVSKLPSAVKTSCGVKATIVTTQVEVNSGKEPSAKEEQAKEAALKKVVMIGQKIAACERFILAKADLPNGASAHPVDEIKVY